MFCFFVLILSAIGTPTYKLAKASFDIESLFTNIPLQETIDPFVGILFQDKTCIDGLNKEHFHEIMTITMFESLVLFDGEYYQQIF